MQIQQQTFSFIINSVYDNKCNLERNDMKTLRNDSDKFVEMRIKSKRGEPELKVFAYFIFLHSVITVRTVLANRAAGELLINQFTNASCSDKCIGDFF